MTHRKEISCGICHSPNTVNFNYLRLNSPSLTRNIAYFIPIRILTFFGKLSKAIPKKINPVILNRRYFDRQLVYCLDCSSGACYPYFEERELSAYYKSFYWANRDVVDGKHLPNEDRPNINQLNINSDRLLWISRYVNDFSSLIDYGAGDCAAAYLYSKEISAKDVHVVDPSIRAHQLSLKYNLRYCQNLSDAPIVEFLYSAHSIEHVHDLIEIMREMILHVVEGGHIFIETPNVADVNLARDLVLTPHTFTLSEATFRNFSSRFPVEIIAMEACGPIWNVGSNAAGAKHRTDLRVLLKKTATRIAET